MPAAAPRSETEAESEARLRAWFDRDVQPLLKQHGGAVMRLYKHCFHPFGIFLLLTVCLAPCVCAAMAWQWLWPPWTLLALEIPTIAVYAARLPLYRAGGAVFRALFKRRVVSRIVAEILPGAHYDPDLQLARSILDASGLLGHGVAYSGDGLVRGTIGRTPFALGDVCAGNARGSGIRGHFQGLFFHAEFNRSLAGRTVVCPHGEDPANVALNDGLVPTTLESPRFEAVFSVYASDPAEARYVLTPKAMERLVSLRHLTGQKLSAAFDHRRVDVAVENGQDAFEALASGGDEAWAEVRGYAALFDTARVIVEELELNSRIWTKGFAREDEPRAAPAVFEPSDRMRVDERAAEFHKRSAALPCTENDPPAPPAHTRIERLADGGLVARYPGARRAALVLVLLATAAGIVSVDPGWWAAHPELSGLGEVAFTIRQYLGHLSLLGVSIAGTALSCGATR
ncbi:MAG TPA: DUF3137 domain-containing protein, partial [Vicinamibacteria bacterium]|nr:DUF3137 domain-containing protein [Vicinamibacteria bacterium]